MSPFAEENPIVSRNSFAQTDFGGDLGEKIKAKENMEGEGDEEGIDMTTDLLSAYPLSATLLSDSESDGDDISDSDSDPDDHKFDFKRKISVRDRNLQNGDRKSFDPTFGKNMRKNSTRGVDKAIEGDSGTFEVEFGSRDNRDGEAVGIEVEVDSEISSDQKNKTNFRRNSEFSLMLPTWQLSELTEPSEEIKAEKNVLSEKPNVAKFPPTNIRTGNEKLNKNKQGTFLALDINQNENLDFNNNMAGSGNENMNDNGKNENLQTSCGTQTSEKSNIPNNNLFTNSTSIGMFSPHSPNATAFFSPPTFSYPSSPVDVKDLIKVGLKDNSLSNIDDNDENNNVNNNGENNEKEHSMNPDDESHNYPNEFDIDGKGRDATTGEGNNEEDDGEEYDYNDDYDDDSIDQHKIYLIDDEFDGQNLNADELKGNQKSQNKAKTNKKLTPEEMKFRKKKLSIDTYMGKDEKKDKYDGPKQPWIRSCSPYAPGGKKKSHLQVLDELSGREMEKEKAVLRERLRSLTKEQMAAEVKRLQSKNLRRMSYSPSDDVRNSLLASPNSTSFNFLNSPISGKMSLLDSPTSGKRSSILELEPSSPRSVHSENVSVLGSSKSSVASHLSKSSIVSRSHSRGNKSTSYYSYYHYYTLIIFIFLLFNKFSVFVIEFFLIFIFLHLFDLFIYFQYFILFCCLQIISPILRIDRSQIHLLNHIQ